VTSELKSPTAGDGPKPLDWGVYYRPSDYAGLLRRVVILVVDTAVLLGVGFLVLFVWFFFHLGASGPPGWLLLVWLALILLYLILIERTTVGTLGYIVASARIVNLQGKRPSIASMALRFSWLALGPLAPLIFLVALLWLTGERHKQTLYDKLAGTYAIKKGAVPAGTGRQRMMIYDLMGLSLPMREVQPGQDGD